MDLQKIFRNKISLRSFSQNGKRSFSHSQGSQQKNFPEEGATENRLKNSKKRPKTALFSLFQEEGATKKRSKIVKNNNKKQQYLASIYYICTMFENPGGDMAILPPAADAHGHWSQL